jgi:hypothetical protein
MPPKKRGRKPKKKVDDNKPKQPPKKRGRKPKGGKIIKKNTVNKVNEKYTPNIILHLKVKEDPHMQKDNIINIEYNPNIENPEAYNLNTNHKNTNLSYQELNKKTTNYQEFKKSETIKKKIIMNDIEKKDNICVKNSMKEIWGKLNDLKKNLKMNNISDKSSSCFWCTCPFDNPPIYIPKNIAKDKVEVYGCFCSPECALSYLKKEDIDTSTMWSRYMMLNNIYCKIYNYEKNIKPAPSPYYMLDKYYGNMNIQEYRKLLKNDRLIMVVGKPMTKILPEIYEENNEEPDIMNNLINSGKKKATNKYKLKSKEETKTKMSILKNNFKVF